jgi:ubiquitin C-terminal hydrolase
MSLISYNTKSELLPFGFRNLGVTCYFNALIQSLLSCTSFTEEFIKDSKYKTNPISALFIELIENAKYLKKISKKNIENDNELIKKISAIKYTLNEFGPNIWKATITHLANKKNMNPNSFMQGMQCAGEGYNYLLESMEEFPILQNLFLHRYKSLIRCTECNDWISNINCTYNLFVVEPDLKREQLDKFKKFHIHNKNMNDFLTSQSGYVDKDYICSKCKTKEERFLVNLLVMIPEIMIVMSKKYNSEEKLNIYTDFPKYMEFKNNNNNNMKYEAVAQIEHSGGLHGGHYWAICKRKGGWFNINDLHVSPSNFQPTNNTYMVIYHLM